MKDPRTEQDGFDAEGHNVPDRFELASTRFELLAIQLAESKKESARFIVIDREIKRRLAMDAAEINLRNVLIGVCAGGLFALAGTILGAYIKSENKVSPTNTVQQTNGGNFNPNLNLTGVTPPQSAASQPVSVPSPVQPNAQASQSRP